MHGKVQSGDNARILTSFFLEDESSFDVVCWKDPYKLEITIFHLSIYSRRTLRGESYIGLKISDGSTLDDDSYFAIHT